jgi:branched-chain amino acid transport system ATP-binding protein
MSDMTGTAPIIEVADVGVSFGGVVALTGVTLEVRRGEVFGLVGSNGAGKSTLLNCICGVTRATHGSLRVLGTDVVGMRADRVAALRLARTFQDPALISDLRVLELAMLGAHIDAKDSFLSCLAGISFRRGAEKAVADRARRALREVGLEDHETASVGALPFGLAKLADLARALASNPEVLLLDEPASGLDSEERPALVTLIKRIAERQRITIVIVEHDMNLVNEICDRIAVMDSGRVIGIGEPRDVLRNPEVQRLLLGL